jgi:hypothetical protein
MSVASDIKKFVRLLFRDDKELLYFTAVLVIMAGLVRIFNYGLSGLLLNISLIPYLIIRITQYIRVPKSAWTTFDKYRLTVLIILVLTLLMDILTTFKAEFLILFLLMIDYLMVIDNKKNRTDQ